MQNTLRLPALDGYIVIDGDTISLMAGEDVIIQIGLEEWETLRETFRFDDVVDYERGETPMTAYQFCSVVEMSRKIKSLEAEKARLEAEIVEK